MAAEEEKEERRSYVILRDDGLLLHTKPITRWEAVWLMTGAYKEVLDLDLRIRYLEEWGNVLDVGPLVERLWDLGLGEYHGIEDIYEGPEKFEERIRSLLNQGKQSPEARQILEELLSRTEEFLREPVEPRPLEGGSVVRYFESPNLHVVPGPIGVKRTVPEARWYARVTYYGFKQYGISVFDDAIWLWGQVLVVPRRASAWLGSTQPRGAIWAVSVRRDASDGDVIAALTKDEAATEFLVRSAGYFREVINAHRMELQRRGYDDVVRKAELVLATAQLLKAGRYREEEEGVPA